MKKFVDIKNSVIFAPELNMPSPIQNANMGGRFVSAHNKDSILSNRTGNRPKAFIGLGKVGSTVFLVYNVNFICTMPSPVKNASVGKYSNHTRTSAYESGSDATMTLQVSNPHGIVCFTDVLQVLQSHFDTEMNSKNKAYSYILSKGLLNDFALWSRENDYDDPHEACVNQLNLLVTSKK